MKQFLVYMLIFSSLLFSKTERNSRSLGVLTFSGSEIQNIDKYISGTTYIDKNIDKEKLLNALPNYDVIHLATHTLVDMHHPKNSKFYILNTNKKTEEEIAIFSSDILSLNLKAKMAVLSSCNTGVGELVEGEGIMSLARDFQFAGVPFIMMTLWEINDISTSEIMNSFYRELKLGNKKDVALRNAKLEYIKYSNSKNSAPVFWAASVPIGEMEKLVFQKSSSEWICFFIFIVIGTLYFLFRIFRKVNQTRLTSN